MRNGPKNGRAGAGSRVGFTLVEIIVMLAIMSLLVAVVVRTVGPRLNRAEASAILGSFDSLNVAVRRFRSNVGQYPSELRQLSQPPGTTPAGEAVISSNGLCGTAASATAWEGPYLDQRATATGLTAAGATIANSITRISGTTPVSATVGRAELVFSAAEVQSAVATLIDGAIDGAVSSTDGMVRYAAPTVTYRVPINGC